MDYYNSLTEVTRRSDLSCPACGADAVETIESEHQFTYGDGDRAVELKAVIPVRRCMKCRYEFLDFEAEDRQHDAVCRHLEVMTPSEVRTVRQQCGGMSRTEFARITRLGEATIGRWERGELIQNAAYDQFLYLLQYPENVERLRERFDGSHATCTRTRGPLQQGNFRATPATVAITKRQEGVSFTLNTAGAA